MTDLYNKTEMLKVLLEEAEKCISNNVAVLVDAIQKDLQDGGQRYEDILIATFGHY